MFCVFSLAWHVGEKKNALVETVGYEKIFELNQNGNADAQRQRRIAEEKRVPKVKDFVQRKNICESNQKNSHHSKSLNDLYMHLRVYIVRNQGIA